MKQALLHGDDGSYSGSEGGSNGDDLSDSDKSSSTSSSTEEIEVSGHSSNKEAPKQESGD